MPEARRGTPRGRRAAVGLVLGLAAIGLLAPVLASERPLLARREGVLLCPALADLPLLGSLFDGPEVRAPTCCCGLRSPTRTAASGSATRCGRPGAGISSAPTRWAATCWRA